MRTATLSARTKSEKVVTLPLCASCEVSQRCFAQCLDRAGTRALDQIIERRFTLKRGEFLFRIGEPFRNLYAIRSGCLKSGMRNEFGREQVVGFYMRGDIVGVGGVGPGVYIFNMRSLVDSEICEIPFNRLEDLACQLPQVRDNVAQILGQWLARGFGTRTLLQKTEVEAKIAGFLLDFAERLAARGYDARRFELPMTRSDIANHLGLNPAAVYRGMDHLCNKHRVVKIGGKSVKLTDVAGLRALAASNA
jgi:CRP/FNR family transcriptional regulator, anaerobic regulatory protein